MLSGSCAVVAGSRRENFSCYRPVQLIMAGQHDVDAPTNDDRIFRLVGYMLQGHPHEATCPRRCGRTARAGAKGLVTSLVGPRDRKLATAIQYALAKGLPLDQVTGSAAQQVGGPITAALGPAGTAIQCQVQERGHHRILLLPACV